MDKWKIETVRRNSKEFPKCLKEIPNPPLLLYRMGAPLNLKKTHVAIVGTRMATEYGLTMADKIARNIAENGGVVVSGLAFGVDAVAHKACVKANKPTVAVLASGLDNITPQSNYWLAKRILETGGTLISEYQGSSESFKARYVQRNRLISGLSKATVVVEAKQISGALITARHAFDQNRDIYALPGDINRPQARGCFKLIDRDMARTITCVPSLIKDLGFDSLKALKKGLSEKQLSIYDLLKKKPACADEIASKLKIQMNELLNLISQMELKGLIRRDFGGSYVLKL